MNRADGTQSCIQILCNGLKPVVIKCYEPTALLFIAKSFSILLAGSQNQMVKRRSLDSSCNNGL